MLKICGHGLYWEKRNGDIAWAIAHPWNPTGSKNCKINVFGFRLWIY